MPIPRATRKIDKIATAGRKNFGVTGGASMIIPKSKIWPVKIKNRGTTAGQNDRFRVERS